MVRLVQLTRICPALQQRQSRYSTKTTIRARLILCIVRDVETVMHILSMHRSLSILFHLELGCPGNKSTHPIRSLFPHAFAHTLLSHCVCSLPDFLCVTPLMIKPGKHHQHMIAVMALCICCLKLLSLIFFLFSSSVPTQMSLCTHDI